MQPISSTRAQRHSRWAIWLTVVTLGGLALRITYLLLSKNPRTPGGDDFYFHHGANLLVDGRGFVDPIALLIEHHVTAGAVHPPGYLLFLAASSLVGFRSFLDHGIWSCLLGSGTIVLVGYTARRLVGPRAGLVAAVIVAIYPNFWFYDSIVMSETLILFTTTLVILLAYWLWERPSLRRAVALGAVVGVAALTRAESILLVLVVVAPLAYVLRELDLRARLRIFGVATAATVVVISPWVIYNLTRFSHPVTLSTNLEATLASANCDPVYHGQYLGFWSFDCVLKLHPPAGDASTKEIYYRHRVLDYMGNHAGRVPIVVLAREGRTWGLFNPIQQVTLDEIEGREPWLSRMGLAMFYALACAAIGGVIVLRRRRVTLVPLLGVIGAVALTVGAVYGTTRFRAPAEVPIVLLAAVAFDEAIGLAVARRRRAVAGAAAPVPVPDADPG